MALSFAPLPYLSDPLAYEAYQNPEVLRKAENLGPLRRRAKANCLCTELMKPVKKVGLCALIPCTDVDPLESVGLFAVPEDDQYDRFIINPTDLSL